MSKHTSALEIGLRDFLVTGGYSPAIIDFDKSIIDKNKRYKVLVLKRPHEIAFEIDQLIWPFDESSRNGLLVFDTKIQKVIGVINLKTNFDFIGLKKECDKELNFDLNSGSFLQEGEYIIVSQRGTIHGSTPNSFWGCIDIAIFSVTGKLLNAWKLNNTENTVSLLKFIQIQENRWFVNLQTHELEYLYMLVPDKIDGFIVAQEDISRYKPGCILDSCRNNVKYWFSDESNMPAVFVLAGSKQLCVYRYTNRSGFDYYMMLTDITIPCSDIEELTAELNSEEISISFSNKTITISLW